MEFKLFSIGTCSQGRIILKKQFTDGLLHLDKFSHALVIYAVANGLHLGIVKMIRVDGKSGAIDLGDCSLQDGSDIIDIKPYFPCEDRVRECSAPKVPGTLITSVRDSKVTSVGQVLRQQGKYVLKFDDPLAVPSLDGCSHIRIIWWFNRFDRSEFRRTVQCNPPYEKAPRTGVFASRSPVRPNLVAITTARIERSGGGEVHVSDLDCFQGTPFIGILPYNPGTDRIDDVTVPEWISHWSGWLDDSERSDASIVIKPSALERLVRVRRSEVADIFRKDQISGRKPDGIIIKGARQNNLKGFDTEIPYGMVTAVTGVSGSGKSSLAFETIYTECRRRFLDVMTDDSGTVRPEIDSMEGAIPAIAVSQMSVGRNPRSTVGTVTGIHDELRLLFASVGVRHCPNCGDAIIPMTIDEIVSLLSRHSGVKVTTLDGRTVGGELHSSVTIALEAGKGSFLASIDGGEPMLLQTRQMCYPCEKMMFELTPALFSFNNPESMCPVCNGNGSLNEPDIDAIVTNPERSLLDGASPLWGNLRDFQKRPTLNWMKGEVLALAQEMGVDLEKPWKLLPEEFRRQVIYGSDGRKVSFLIKNSKIGRDGTTTRPVEGAYNTIRRLFEEGTSDRIAAAFMKRTTCTACKGERLGREGRMVTVGGTRFPEVVAMSITDLKAWCEKLPEQFTDMEFAKAGPVLLKLHDRLRECHGLGLSYLTLDRTVPSLSGGEAKRLKLVMQLGSDISGMLYVLDEPTAGLHPKDYMKLLEAIRGLCDRGNTVLLVEHNADLIRSADRLIDLGPGAGEGGGHIVAEGTIDDIMRSDRSETGKYLSGKKRIGVPGPVKPFRSFVKVEGIRHNNLRNIDIEFPVGAVTCVTGVSGSGKSSLVEGVLYPAFDDLVHGTGTDRHCDKISGAEKINAVILVDQTPIGRTPRSVPATYTGIMDEVRELFASTPQSKEMGLIPSSFSFNSPLGCCDSCHGDGMIAAAFLNDVWVTCSVCGGRRYKGHVLEVRYNGKGIDEILSMSVSEAVSFFAGNERLEKVLVILIEVGLGYIKLGQNSATLSGGEAQRIKLAKHLCAAKSGRTLYLLDEPMVGLHFSDVQNLLVLLRRLSDIGNTVMIIEHDMDVVSCVDWVIDLGPGGGEDGGLVMAQGVPKEIIKIRDSRTGQCLRERQ